MLTSSSKLEVSESKANLYSQSRLSMLPARLKGTLDSI